MTAMQVAVVTLVLFASSCMSFTPPVAARRTTLSFSSAASASLTVPTTITTSLPTYVSTPTALRASPLSDSTMLLLPDLISEKSDAAVANAIDMIASSLITLAETEAWVGPLSNVLGPFLNFFSFAMLCRIVLSWYPTANVNEVPFNVVVWPTEPLLRLLRGTVPPAFGVDITPVVWLGLFSFMNEIFLGQQGLLTMKIKYGI